MQSVLLWTLFLPATAFAAMVVEVSPRRALFRIGDRETVRCVAKGCTQTPSFSWVSLEDKPLYADTHHSGSESVITYKSIERHHENTLQCKVSCGDQLKHGKVTVKVYAFPEAPVISGHERLVLGQPNAALKCEATGVYPAEFTYMGWWEGGSEVVEDVEGLPNSRRLEAIFPLTPSLEDDGRNITCRATHQWLDTHIQTTVTFSVLRAPDEVQVSGPEEVQVGDALSLRCAAQGKPRPRFQWRVLHSGEWVELQGGQELMIGNASHAHTGLYQCLASNELGQRNASLHVTIHGPPRNTSLTLSPAQSVMEGESVMLSCRTLSVPEGRVRLLHVSEGEEAELKSRDGNEVSITLPSVQLTHAGLYRCEASNRYGTHTNSTQLTVKAYPLSLRLLPVGVVPAEIGSALSLLCVASGCPLPRFSWAFPAEAEGAVLILSNHTHSELRLQAVNSTQEGNYTCHAHCGSAAASAHTQVALYAFPSVLIQRSGSLLEGENSTFRCVLRNAFPPEAFRIRWFHEDQELLTPTLPPATGQTLQSSVSMTMEPSLRGHTLTCWAELQMEGVVSERRRSSADIIIDVHSPPRNTSLALSPAQSVMEGESVTLSCQTLSVPEGRVRLLHVSEGEEAELKSHDGNEVSITLPAVQLTHAGLYRCEASNRYGSHTNSTQLTIKAPPRNMTVEVFPSRRVTEGDNVTICCRSLSFPPPVVTLTKLGNATELYSLNGTFHLTNLSPSDAGEYQVNVTNDLGFHTQVFTLSVMERSRESPGDWEELLIPAVVMGTTVASAALLLDFLCRSRRRGSYELAKCNPNASSA